MSILIKGMEMPKNCNVCNFHMLRFCCAADKDLAEKDTRPLIERRPESCPLVRVPPHGDLIDRDKLREKEFIHDGDAYAVVMSRDIRNAATIIPADKDGET